VSRSCPCYRFMAVCFLWSVFPQPLVLWGILEALDFNRCFQSGVFTERTLRFRQSSFHLAIRVSPVLHLRGFNALRFP
jgi:hypothetical protein